MVDNFALALTHGLLALVAWRLVQRADVDSDPPAEDAATAAPEPNDRRTAPQRRMIVKPPPRA